MASREQVVDVAELGPRSSDVVGFVIQPRCREKCSADMDAV